jgi:hypothetical protein
MWLTFSIIIDLLPEQGIVIGGSVVVVSRSQALWVVQLMLIGCGRFIGLI